MLLAIDSVALGQVVASSAWPRSIITSPAFDHLSRVLQVISGGLLTVGASVCGHWTCSVCARPVLVGVIIIPIFAAYAAS